MNKHACHCEPAPKGPLRGRAEAISPGLPPKGAPLGLRRLRLLAMTAIFLSMPAFAQIGPVAPKAADPGAETNAPNEKPVMDLPYKPQGGPSQGPAVAKPDGADEDAAPTPPKAEIAIPFIPSKSPVPVGAPDPVF